MVENAINNMIVDANDLIGVLESRLTGGIIPTRADMDLNDRIMFQLGVISGLNQALFTMRAHKEDV